MKITLLNVTKIKINLFIDARIAVVVSFTRRAFVAFARVFASFTIAPLTRPRPHRPRPNPPHLRLHRRPTPRVRTRRRPAPPRSISRRPSSSSWFVFPAPWGRSSASFVARRRRVGRAREDSFVVRFARSRVSRASASRTALRRARSPRDTAAGAHPVERWFGSVRFGSVRFGSVRFDSVRFDLIAWMSISTDSTSAASRRTRRRARIANDRDRDRSR